MNRYVCILLMLTSKLYYAQNDSVQTPKPDFKWVQTNKATLDISEVTFVNWNAGGSNSISALLNIISRYDYTDSYYKWRNTARARYGINQQEEQRLRKTEDELELISTLGYRKDSTDNWFFSGRFNFKTQFTDGFNYPDRDNPISRFMAPGYLFLGGGAEYGKNVEKFSLYMSPLTIKSTFVFDETLANAGSFGTEPAVVDEEGNIIKEGERVRLEMGILITNFFETELFKNIDYRQNLSLYTDYLNSFGNIDVDWEVVFDFKVNNFVRATFGSHIRYDDDIKILEEVQNEEGTEFVETGARIQWKQALNVGVVYEF
ncbi:MAG: DUF3078 domain-containing protein [Bacteroidota bacterium]